MNPIVDGIAQEYLEKIDVRKLNVLNEGRAAFEYFRMTGHPGYVLLKPDGTRVWTQIGIVSREDMASQLDAVLAARS